MWIVLGAPARTVSPATIAVRWQEPAASTQRPRGRQWTSANEGQGAALGTQPAGRPLEPVS